MKRRSKITLVILVVVLFMTACSVFELGNRQVSSTRSTSKSTFIDKFEIEEIELEVKPNMHSNVLRINNIKLEEGEITLRLLNPDKAIITEEFLVAPTKYSERFDLEIIPGVWKLEIDISNASGSYDIKWEAKY